jgi:hypothetical protein
MKYFLFLAPLFLVFNTFSQINTLCFSDPEYQMAGSLPYDITSADFNNDGKVDIAVANNGSDSISIILNLGNGSFASTINYHAGLNPWRIISIDLNLDGNMDIVTVNTGTGSTNGDVSVLLGNGTGVFTTAVNYFVGTTPVSIAGGDFNHDGKIDLVVSGIMDTYFLFGQGNGNFNQATTYGLGWTGEASVSGDFNGDGYADVAFIDAQMGANMSVLLASNMFPQIYNTGGVDCLSMVTGDYNNDGILDIATCGQSSAQVLFGFGNGAFDNPIIYPLTGILSLGMTSSDLDNDGNLDLIFANNGSHDISVLYGSTNGSFVLLNKSFKTGIGTSPMMITSSDFNGDGKLDLAIADNGTGNISVLLNSINPNVTVSGSNIICIGSGVTLQASGAATYSWSTGDTTSVNYQTPVSTNTYTVVGTGINYCSNSQTISVVVDNTCQDVWPGDANSNGRVNNLDILELGLHYAQTGPPRATTSNTWQSYFSNNWTGTITNGKNLNHSDCNGDGTINDDDTLAIYNNYGLVHAFKPTEINTVNPKLSIVPDQPGVVKGAWGTASIYLGDATNPINNINGVAFTVDFDNTLIETNSVYIEYQNSFLDAGQNLHFRKLDFANSKIFTANTHTVNNNVSGNGKIGTLHYQIKSTLTTDDVLNLGISQANQSDASGIITPLTSGTATLMAMGSSVGLQELSGSFISVSPNPTNGSLTINSKTELQKIALVSITGQVLLTETPTNVSHTLHLENFSNGIYFVNVYQNDRIVKREKIVLNK